MAPDGRTFTHSSAEDIARQREIVRQFVLHLYKLLVRDFRDDWVEIHFLSNGLLLDGMLKNRILLHLEDYPGPFIITGAILFLRIQNVFVTTCSAMLIYCSIWTTVCLTRDLFGVTYFSQHHAFVVLLMSAFQANQIVFFIDAWRQSGQFSPEIIKKIDKKRRMSYVFRRAVRSLATVALTSLLTFIAAIQTPIMPMQALGAWGAVFTVVNFFAVVVMMPSFVVFYEDMVLVCVDNLGKLRLSDHPRQRPQVNVVRPFFEAYMVQRHIEDFFEQKWSYHMQTIRYFLTASAFVGMILAISQPAGSGLLPLQKPEHFIPPSEPILASIDLH